MSGAVPTLDLTPPCRGAELSSHITIYITMLPTFNNRCLFFFNSYVKQSLQSSTYLLTPCSTVRLEKLSGSQLVKKFPALYGTRKFSTAFTSALHPSLS